jgi:3-carboxy-cis,cis-muconate cycloisomerase
LSSRLIHCLSTTPELDALFSDSAVLSALLAFESALARAQARLGLIPASAAASIAQAADTASFEAASIANAARRSATPVIPLVDALTERVREIDEPASRYVHFGATSQDAVDTAIVLLLKRAEPILSQENARLEAALRHLSETHAGAVMLARTVLQPAPPITFGYKAASWYGLVHRSWRAVASSFAEALQLQFGGAAGTLASYGAHGPALANALAAEVGLPPALPPWPTSRDRLAALVAALGIYTAALGKIARDVSLLMQHEVAEAAESGGGSSAMPHKRNPSGCALTLAAATRMPGLVATFLSEMIQEHERAAGPWQAEWETLSSCVQTAGSALSALDKTVSTLTVFPERMRQNLASTLGVVYAEKLLVLLAPQIGRAESQRLLSEAVHQAIETTKPLREIVTAHSVLSTLLTRAQIDSLELPEDYLGATEVFRRRLLEQ